MEKRLLAEDRLQQECYMWFHNTFAAARGLLRYNLNNSANAMQGNKNKAMGLQAGASDMELHIGGRLFFLELKVEKGRQSKGQQAWQTLVEAQGFNYYVIRSKEEFIRVVQPLLVEHWKG